jgi:Tfp pilus assembly protein PilO
MNNVLKKREKVILCLTIIIVIFSIAFHFVIGPVLEKYDALAKEINVSKNRLKKYLTLLSRKGEIQNRYGRFSSKLIRRRMVRRFVDCYG